ncbi:MAG TPA: hypothetical protein VFB82_21715 [Blastocatellia bacterium]|nr:hypothetical protein [Blastocatellia bacterium]
MIIRTWLLRIFGVVLVMWTPFVAQAQNTVNSSTWDAGNSGVSALWIFANISYAGMRAQNHAGAFWRVIAFIFGFPGTLLTLILVEEGSERAYGIDLPRRGNDEESVN